MEYKESNWYSYFDAVIHKAKKYPLLEIDYLPVYEEEMEFIQKVKGVRKQKLLFTAMCAAKYYNTINEMNNNWVNFKYKDLFVSANTIIGKTKQCEIIGELSREGSIVLSKKINNLNFQIPFIQASGREVLKITDLDNLGYQYLAFMGNPEIKHCACCGTPFRDDSLSTAKKRSKPGRRKKYCSACRDQKLLERYSKYYYSKKA